MLDVDKSVGFKKSLADIQMVCEEELNGSTMLRDVHLLVGRPIDILVNIYLLRERLPNISTKVVLLNCSGKQLINGLTVIFHVRTPAHILKSSLLTS